MQQVRRARDKYPLYIRGLLNDSNLLIYYPNSFQKFVLRILVEPKEVVSKQFPIFYISLFKLSVESTLCPIP